MYAYGPGIDKLKPVMNNIDLGKYLTDLFQFDLQEITDSLSNFNTSGVSFYDLIDGKRHYPFRAKAPHD